MSIEHYVGMVRRQILGDLEIARMCHEMYQEHKRAFDLIYEHRPDVRAEIRNILEGLVENERRIERDSGRKNIIRFVVRDWDTLALRTSSGWTQSGRIFMFEFWNSENNLTLALVVGPGPDETRERLFSMARVNGEPFENPWKAAEPWYVIYRCEFLTGEMYEDADQAAREEEIRRQWNEFLDKDLPRIEEAVRSETWIWEPGETDTV